MSLFKRPRKPMQPRVFSTNDDNNSDAGGDDGGGRMDVDEEDEAPPLQPQNRPAKEKKAQAKSQAFGGGDKPIKSSLLSFDDEEDDTEVFQVRKSSHSKKVMKKLDKERRKKKNPSADGDSTTTTNIRARTPPPPPNISSYLDDEDADEHADVNANGRHGTGENSVKRSHDNSNSIQTEILTDDFVVVLKNSEQSQAQVLNGRAALCAGRDDMSSDDDEADRKSAHRFAKPDNFKTVLESGAIPDAAMIHAARKRRQKAREGGDFIPIEEKPAPPAQPPKMAKGKGRLVREDGEDDGSGSDEDRVDMAAIKGGRELEERREKFYAVQQDSGDDSDPEMTEWENQQIRKGVTGAQLVSAQQESIYGQFMMKPADHKQHQPMDDDADSRNLSTGTKLAQAYARSAAMDQAHQLLSGGGEGPKKSSTSAGKNGTSSTSTSGAGPRMPTEVQQKLRDRLQQVRQLHERHVDEEEKLGKRLDQLCLTGEETAAAAPVAAQKYRFYQELRGYVTDLVECVDEKLPSIVDLERRALALMAKQAQLLIERRRQDVRDQAKEIAEQGKPGAARKMLDDEERARRCADREGRRTRRRQTRERIDIGNQHMDGMSSDDEIHEDAGPNSYRGQLDQIAADRQSVFADVSDDFSAIAAILERFEEWRRTDYSAYTDTYFSICLPKVLGPWIRLHLAAWNPLDELAADVERMEWHAVCMKYAWQKDETEEQLAGDPDVRLVPTLVEKIILPKLTEIVDTCWDPVSSTQTLRLVGVVARLGREYPSLKPTSKYLRTLFTTVLDKMKAALDHDVFIPIFPKQLQEARSSFFQRQFSSALKLLRNILSWQGLLADETLKAMAITTLLNRNLMMAMRVCSPADAVSKASIIVNTLPRVWLHPKTGHLESLQPLLDYLRTVQAQLDVRNPVQKDTIDKMNQVLHSLHAEMI